MRGQAAAPADMRPVAVIQHDPVQGPGMLTQLLHQWDIPVVHIHPAQGDALPRSSRAFSGIAMLGSDHSVNDPVRWIHDERALIRDALSHDVPVLGHCFGAQMLASATGAHVRRLPRPDIGWRMLRPTPHARDLFGADEAIPSFNWHHETFDIPSGAKRILVGENCLNKGFQVVPHLALQCHLEVTAETLAAWCQHGASELQAENGPTAQRASQILAEAPVWLPAVHGMARRVYGRWVAQLSECPLTSMRHTPHRLDAFLMQSVAHSGQRRCAAHEHRPRTPRSR